MDDTLKLPVFPLPNVILFPRTMLPLHIFEPRYREMIKDLLEKPENERLIVISNLYQNNMPLGTNPFANVATVGKLVHVEYLEDGRSNIVLHGQFTALVEEIVPSETSYRMCEVKTIREEYWTDPLSDHQEDYNKLLQSIYGFMERTNSDIKNLEDVKVDDLINGLAYSLNIESDEKQELLELQELNLRLDKLVEIIEKVGYYSEYIPDEDEYEHIN